METQDAINYLLALDKERTLSIKKVTECVKVVEKFTKNINKMIEKMLDTTAAQKVSEGLKDGDTFQLGQDTAKLVQTSGYSVGSEEMFDWLDINFPGTVKRSPSIHWQTLKKTCSEIDPENIEMLIKKGALSKVDTIKIKII